ncbi:lipase family protein [Mycobacterium lacus]|nr:lipase family protein [Mycobacterium lacus]
MARRAFLANLVLAGGVGALAQLAGPGIMQAHASGPDRHPPTGLDPEFALDVLLPLCLAAYAIVQSPVVTLPSGYEWTAKVIVDPDVAAARSGENPTLTRIATNESVFGMMGRNASTRTAFLAFRGTVFFDDVITDLGIMPTPYFPVDGFGWVHSGFLFIYRLLQNSISTNLAAACAGCDQLLVTGHSLGAALAVLAAPDIMKNMLPSIELKVITFAGPIAGLWDFASTFDRVITSCYRLVNWLDLVPYLPPPPYEHVNIPVEVDSGGSIDPLWRHSLYAYQAGLQTIIKSRRR